MKGMIGALKQMQRRARSQAFDDRLEQAQFRQRIARALQEQHRDFDIGEMLGAVAGRLSGRMQRKTEKREPANAGQGRKRLRLRRHSPAERSAARDQRQRGTASPGFRHGGANGRMRHRRRIGPLAAFFHVGKLIAQRRNAAFGEASRNRFHRRMGHAGAGAVREHVTRARLRRLDQQGGDLLTRADLNSKRLRANGCHMIRPISICMTGTLYGDRRRMRRSSDRQQSRPWPKSGHGREVSMLSSVMPPERKSRFSPIWSTNGFSSASARWNASVAVISRRYFGELRISGSVDLEAQILIDDEVRHDRDVGQRHGVADQKFPVICLSR